MRTFWCFPTQSRSPRRKHPKATTNASRKAQAAVLQQAREEAQRILEKAKSEAAAILAAANSEAESIRDSAYRQGYEEGRAEANRELALKKIRVGSPHRGCERRAR